MVIEAQLEAEERLPARQGRSPYFPCPLCGRRMRQRGQPKHVRGFEGSRLQRRRWCQPCGTQIKTIEFVAHSNTEGTIAGRILIDFEQALDYLGLTDSYRDYWETRKETE